jgi:hypothetical protein
MLSYGWRPPCGFGREQGHAPTPLVWRNLLLQAPVQVNRSRVRIEVGQRAQ